MADQPLTPGSYAPAQGQYVFHVGQPAPHEMHEVHQTIDTFKWTNGTHVLQAIVTEASGRVTKSAPVPITITNPEIDIRAQDEDSWVVTRRKTDTGKQNKLEVDRSVTVRINGVNR